MAAGAFVALTTTGIAPSTAHVSAAHSAAAHSAAASLARVPFLLIAADGSAREVMVYAITPDAISIDDGTGTVEEIPVSACLALVQSQDGRLARAAERPSIRRSRGWVRLRSGEQLPGVLGTGDVESPDAYPWVHASFGRLELPLDELDTMVFRSTDDPGPIDLDDGDRLVLRNGDLIDGFIAEVGAEGSSWSARPKAASRKSASRRTGRSACVSSPIARSRRGDGSGSTTGRSST